MWTTRPHWAGAWRTAPTKSCPRFCRTLRPHSRCRTAATWSRRPRSRLRASSSGGKSKLCAPTRWSRPTADAIRVHTGYEALALFEFQFYLRASLFNKFRQSLRSGIQFLIHDCIIVYGRITSLQTECKAEMKASLDLLQLLADDRRVLSDGLRCKCAKIADLNSFL